MSDAVPPAPKPVPIPTVPELALNAPSADDLTILAHLKAWVGREIGLVQASQTLAQRQKENP